ncbi:MAG: peptide chain release factor N(5)-glutamine methyltransferase, partial [Candidatus Omnitrophica bacterium]|nr:peptide chain release factor N(5)-glutamine methyltransferase [Candidatus Omnitrophota bacterium]
MTEAEILFAEVLGCDRMSLYRNRALPLNAEISKYIGTVLKRRIHGEPLQYILGKTEFMGLEFKVEPGVLIPRQETEILVEKVVQEVTKSQGHNAISLSLLDLGTGSGCIAVFLAKMFPAAKITAVDISEQALRIAKQNAILHGVDERIQFIQGNLLSPYAVRRTQYDIIVSNPPYIPSWEISQLQPEIAYEPRIALDGGEDGLDFYRKIALTCGRCLKIHGK